ASAEKTAPTGEGKKPRAPKTKEPKDKAAPAAPPAESPAAAAPAPAPAATTPSAPGEPQAKKKGKQPGIPPRRGKKLRNVLKAQVQKVTKEGPVPLKKAVSLLKSL